MDNVTEARWATGDALFVEVRFESGAVLKAGWMLKADAHKFCADAIASGATQIAAANRSEDHSWLRGHGWN